MSACHIKTTILGLVALILCSSAQAELINTTYTNTNGETASSTPDAKYMNPTGQMTFALSGGLDRKVRIELRQPSGVLIDSATSVLIGSTDKITVDGNDYFGAILTLPNPGEGEYVTVAQILDNGGEVVQSDQHPWTLDRTGYRFDGIPEQSQYDRYASNYGKNWEIVNGHRVLSLKAPVIGEGAPLESAVLTTTAQSTGEASTFSGFTISETGVAGTLPRDSTLWPDREGYYSMNLAVTDTAGNVTHEQWETRFDDIKNPFTVVGITYAGNDRPHPWSNVDGLEEFTPYEDGMTVDTESPRLLLKTEVGQIWPSGIFGQFDDGYCAVSDNEFCANREVVHYADGMVYLITARGTLRSYSIKTYHARGSDRADNETAQQLRLAAKPGLAVRPQYSVTSIKFADGDVVQGRLAKRNGQNDERYDEIRLKLSQAYSFPIEITDNWNDLLTIPAGETSGTLKTTHRYTRYLKIKACPSGSPGTCQVEHTSVSVDNNPPELIKWSYQQEGRGAYRVELLEKYALTSNPWGVKTATVIATDENGEEHVINPASHKNETGLYTFIFPIQALPTGQFDISLRAVDTYGNKASWSLESRVYDGDAPTIALQAYGSPLGEVPLKTLGDITLLSSDDSGDVVPDSVQLIGGPANETINLAWSKKDDGSYALEYPIMFPSIEEGDYRIDAKVIDPTGNVASASNAFTFEPVKISMAADSQGTVTIPAINHAFKRENGGDLIHTEPFTLYDGSVLQGTYDVYATVRADATIPLLINGVRVEPGQTLSVVGDHDFSSSGGSLNIPVAAADIDRAGTADVLVSTSAPGAAVVATRVAVWKADVELDAPSWTVNQAIDEVEIDAKADSGTICEVTTNKREAERASVLDAPVCYLEWNSLPLGTTPAKEAAGEGDGPGVRGRAYQRGDQKIRYSVWVYDYAGNPYLLQQSSRILTVADPDGAIAFSTDKDVSEVYYAVQSLDDVSLEQNSGPECMTTTSAEDAQRSVGSRRLTCLIEWTNLPAGLEQLTFRDQPQLRGHANQRGNNELSWRVSAFSSTGQKIVLNEQSLTIDATEPPAPAIAIDKDNRITTDMYAAPLDGGYVGDARITSYNAALDVDVTRAGETIDSLTSPGGWGDSNVVQRRINSDKRELWSQTEYGVSARYDLIDDSIVSKNFTVLAVPSLNVAPVIEADGDTVLNTEPLRVEARIDNPFEEGGYDPDTMGEWQVRIVSLHGRDVTPVSDYQNTSASGSKTFTLDLDQIDDMRMRLAAQARIVSPVDGYERTVLSSRPIYMTVLRGQPIDSTIEGRRISGEAPLTAVMTLKIDNRLDRAALGEVEWQVSADQKNWSPLENTARYETRFIHRFERGNYYVRAIVNNKNSGAVFQTPTVAVSAYLLPAIALSGPENAFIGAVADYTVAPDQSNKNNDPSTPLVYQWSTDRGEVWVDGDASFHISRAEETRLPVWVRARYETAPADDDYAWTRERTRISFRKVRAPRVRIIGPRLIETGKPREFRASVRAPYRKMNIQIKGTWTLPDDSQSDASDELTYTANDSDLAKERVNLGYTAWIVGYKDQEAVDTDNLSLRIWQYEWPEFEITIRQGSDYAPADLVARIRSRGTARYRDLDQPEIEWSVPEGLTAVGEARSTVRSFETSLPGEYVLRATITDARGHTADVSKTLVLKPAPPYQFDFRYTASNRYDRAPMEIRVRPYISGGHPRDRIESYSYTLDGQPVEAQSRFGEMMITQAGKHRVGVTIQTQMGNTAEGHLDLTAKANQSPTCAINARSASAYWRFYARCEDPDGRMAGYNWTLNGEKVGTSSYRITVRNDGAGAPTVKVIGEDDSGATSAPVTWHGDP